MSNDVQRITPPQLADRWGCSVEKVLALIHGGQLIAVNLAINPSGRPRFVISEQEVQAFELRRATRKVTPAKRRKAVLAGIREYF